MNGMLALLRKEALEIRHTSRKWILPGIVLLCAIVAPVLTYYLPEIAKGQTVDATVFGAGGTFFSFLSSLFVLSIVSATSGIVSSEVRSGEAVLAITKPVSRRAYVLSKIISQSAVVIVATLIGTAVFALIARVLFGTVPLVPLLAGVGTWLALALFYTVAMVVLSAALRSHAAVGGIGVGIYIAFSVLASWGPGSSFTPAGIRTAAESLLRGGDAGWLWPTATSLVLVALLVSLSGRAFARREI